MANSTISGNSLANGATLVNATNGAGVPLQDPSRVTVQLTDATAFGFGAFFDVNMSGGNDTLVAWNMPWVNPDSGQDIGFDDISMGDGNDLVDLNRSGFYGLLDMGAGADTLTLTNSGGNDVWMGTGNDLARLDFSESGAASEEELAQKVGQSPVSIDGQSGIDTLNLVGDWTLTLTSGNATLDTNYDGFADMVTNVVRADQYGMILGLPALLAGTVQWGDTITLGSGDTVLARATFSNFEVLEAICFAEGTRIATPDGEVAIEALCVGDPVLTREGPKPVRWIGKRRLDLIDLMANPKLLPILIPAGAFGDGRPARARRLAPQHRVVVRSQIVERMFNTDEVLVQAKQLVGVHDIQVDGETREVVYYHMMLDSHAVVQADGLEAETLFPGPMALSFVTEDARAELMELFPELAGDDAGPSPALPMLKGRDARALIARHGRAEKALWS